MALFRRIIFEIYTAHSKLNCLLLLIIVSSSSFFILYQYHKRHINKFEQVVHRENDRNFLIETPGCKIQAIKIFDENVKKLFKKSYTFKSCPNRETALLENNETHIWVIKENIGYHNNDEFEQNVEHLNCCYQGFYRPVYILNITSNAVDHRVEYKECIAFSDIVEVEPQDEFVRVKCFYRSKNIYNKLFLFAPLKKFLSHDDSTELPISKSSYNVLIIGVDSISRLNMHRTMPKTLTYLKELGAIELFGYHNVGADTFSNVIPLLLGIKDTEIKKVCLPYKEATFDNCPFVWEWYKQAGYFTALGEDSSVHGIFNYLRSGFSGTPTDYYIHPFIRQAEHYGYNSNNTNQRPLCQQERYFYEILLDYIASLTSTMMSHRLFGFFWDVNLRHDSLNNAEVLDNGYETLFKRLNSSKYLDQTIVLFVSDHGLRWREILKTHRGRLEARLPFVHIIVPQSFRTKYRSAYNNLQQNSGRLTTPFDIHATLSDLINLNNVKNFKILARSRENYSKNRGISLFLPMPLNRTCKMADIDYHWCACLGNNIVVNDIVVQYAVKLVMKYLNKLLRSHPQCARLEMEELVETLKTSADENRNSVMVVLRTAPGGGLFKATVIRGEGHTGWYLAGSVNRLNQYGHQSHCIDVRHLKRYCYCPWRY